ncbi:MAG: hypothetical protein GQ582_07345 [Methyloprofundus sp.]|nr:hypothetical protein [Methyloprofundus sp.]
MSLEQRLLVKENIELLGDNINALSQIFFRELFHLDISLERVFPGNVIVLNRKFSNMLSTLKNVQHLEKIAASVEKMGERHILQYGAQLSHFETMQQALMLALKDYHGDLLTAELEQAWNSAFADVAEIMAQAMSQVDRRQVNRTAYKEEPYDNELLTEAGGVEGITAVHRRFYNVMFDEPWVGQFFYGKSKEALIAKQTKFMVAAFGGENLYTGDTPAFMHMHMFVTDEMIKLRQRVLRKAILDEGFSESVADRWLQVDDSFTQSIVKKSTSECVLKCVGQMPVVVKKPADYQDKSL